MGACSSSTSAAARRYVNLDQRAQASREVRPRRACKLRILGINDVYELDNFPRVKTLLNQHKANVQKENVVTTLAGDFVAPSLLSSLDGGAGMVEVLNALPIDYVCFGNHESDIPYLKLKMRIREFGGVWLNSNMPGFELAMPEYSLQRLRGLDGNPDARSVAFIGLVIGGGQYSSIYREGVFGGAGKNIVPVNEAAPTVSNDVRGKHPDVDEVIPLTHQDMAQDVDLAKTGLFPVIIGGHDHEVLHEVHGDRDCPVVKSGSDAHNVSIIDLEWSDDPAAPPSVTVQIEPVAGYEPDPDMVAMVERIMETVKELELATLYELRPDEIISSINVRTQQTSLGELVATAIREVFRCDAAVLNSGALRGNREYAEGISYGDLKRECPFPSPIVVTQMPFEVLREAVHQSRQPWWDIKEGEQPKEHASALQVDEGIRVRSDHVPIAIRRAPPELGKLYSVACDTRVLARNPIFCKYCQEFPSRIPPDDAGRPVLPILAEFFCGMLWRQLIEHADAGSGQSTLELEITRSASMASKDRRAGVRQKAACNAGFDSIDVNGDEIIDREELTRAVERCLGRRVSSRIVVEQMMSMMDEDNDGQISREELRDGMSKISRSKLPYLVSL